MKNIVGRKIESQNWNFRLLHPFAIEIGEIFHLKTTRFNEKTSFHIKNTCKNSLARPNRRPPKNSPKHQKSQTSQKHKIKENQLYLQKNAHKTTKLFIFSNFLTSKNIYIFSFFKYIALERDFFVQQYFRWSDYTKKQWI